MGGKGVRMMNKEGLEIIHESKYGESKLLCKEEKDVALKILNDLEGTLVIRATSILEFGNVPRFV
ncbi:hypothetical protein [Clostridium sp.]|uniref:hypothetical protein n=1 Tax=Clostridium sp. TaxID=1506 RepID=UPI00359FDB84